MCDKFERRLAAGGGGWVNDEARPPVGIHPTVLGQEKGPRLMPFTGWRRVRRSRGSNAGRCPLRVASFVRRASNSGNIRQRRIEDLLVQ